MKLSIIIDSNYVEPLLEIHTAAVSKEVQKIVDTMNLVNEENKRTLSKNLFMISAWKNETITFLKPSDIMHIYSCNKKIYAISEDSEYELKYRLYEIESLIEEHSLTQFIRISNTDIVNFDFVRNLDMSLTGAICVNFRNNSKAFVSRRYVSVIREKLGINTKKAKETEGISYGENTNDKE